MKKGFVSAVTLSLGLLTANAALANDAVIGAIVGGGLGAVVGNQVSGRNGAVIGGAVGAAAGAAIASDNDRDRNYRRVHGYYVAPAPVPVYAPPPVYQVPVYAPPPVYYAPPPVRVVTPPVVYVPAYGRAHHHQYYRHDGYYGRGHDWR